MSASMLFTAVFLISVLLSTDGACQNRCNKNGVCNKFGICECFTGFKGAECSLKSCPYGPVIGGIATSNDTLHDSNIECSGKGKCDYETGNCVCFPLYGGAACGVMTCYNQCSDRGICTSLRQAAIENDNYRFNRTTVYTQWDADLFRGCKCDPGWSGPDCSVRECSYGVDPRTSTTPHEVVSLVCTCNAQCRGKFKLRFLGRNVPKWLTPTSTSTDLASALTLIAGTFAKNFLYTYDSVTTISTPNKTICASNKVTTTQFKFRKSTANIPTISFYANMITGGSVYFQTTQMLHCDCTNRACNGTFRLSFDGEMSNKLKTWGNSSDIVSVLRNMSTIASGGVTVMGGYATDSPVCVAGTITNHTITFRSAYGNVPQLQLWSSVIKGPTAQSLVYYSTTNSTDVLTLTKNGGKEDTVKLCNGIGKCNTQTATCQCPYVSGVRPDCPTLYSRFK